MHSIGMNMVTLRDGREAGLLLENLDRIASAGFQGVGIWTKTIEDWLGQGNTLSQLSDAVGSRGLNVDELCFVNALDDSGEAADRTREFEWAAQLGCGNVIAIYGNPDTPLEKVRADWAAFVERIEGIGVSPAFEFIGMWPQYNSPLSAWEVIKAGPELGKMVFDTFHFWRGGGDLTQIAMIPGDRVGLVHLNDAKDVPRNQATDKDRTYPGQGVIPLREILNGLRQRGFSGPLSVEIFGAVQEQDPGEVCTRAYEATERLLEGL